MMIFICRVREIQGSKIQLGTGYSQNLRKQDTLSCPECAHVQNVTLPVQTSLIHSKHQQQEKIPKKSEM